MDQKLFLFENGFSINLVFIKFLKVYIHTLIKLRNFILMEEKVTMLEIVRNFLLFCNFFGTKFALNFKSSRNRPIVGRTFFKDFTKKNPFPIRFYFDFVYLSHRLKIWRKN
jgi:hypothetical protein